MRKRRSSPHSRTRSARDDLAGADVMLAVHVRINDEATNRPVAVCLRITDAAGRYCPPLGRLAEFATAPGRDVGGQVRLGAEAFAFIDGACEARLPPGTLNVEVER